MECFKREIKKIRSNSLAKNTGWVLLGQVSSYATQAAYFVVLSRLLGVTQFGILAGAVAFVGILAPYGSMGSGIVFMHHVSAGRENCQLYMGNVFLSSMFVSGFLIFGLWLMAPHVLDRQGASIVWMVAIASCLCSQLIVSISQIFQTFEMPKKMMAFNVINNTMRLLAAIAFKVFARVVHARQWAMADMSISLLIAVASIFVVVRHFGIPRFSIRLFFRRIAEGFGYAISLSASAIYNNFDKTLLSHYAMNVANGIYSLAYRITNLATMPSYAIEMAAVPRMFQKAAGSMREFQAYGHALLKRSIASGAVVSVILYVCAPVIPCFVGSRFQSSVLALRWLCLLPLFRSVHEIAGSMLTASGHQRYRVMAQFTVAGLNLILDVWLIPSHGWLGAAWASLATDAVLALVCYTAIKSIISRALRKEEQNIRSA